MSLSDRSRIRLCFLGVALVFVVLNNAFLFMFREMQGITAGMEANLRVLNSLSVIELGMWEPILAERTAGAASTGAGDQARRALAPALKNLRGLIYQDLCLQEELRDLERAIEGAGTGQGWGIEGASETAGFARTARVSSKLAGIRLSKQMALAGLAASVSEVERRTLHAAIGGLLGLLGMLVGCDFLIARELRRRELELIRANDRLRKLAATDPLTGLSNRGHFEEALALLSKHCRDRLEPLSMVLLDLDDFKQYNDSHGHPAGDEALRISARIIRDNVRDRDLAFRLGGEEFGVLLPDTEEAAAYRLAERLRVKFAECPWPKRQVHASFGVAQLEANAVRTNQLLKDADRALYASKNRGRNRVMASSELPPPEPSGDGLLPLMPGRSLMPAPR